MKIVVVGGGASGMLCAALAAKNGAAVTLIEQNEKLGKKLFITGKGRCNFTNACPPDEFMAHVLTNPRFLYSASASMTPDDVIALFESWGLRTKVERGRRAFPASDRSADVIDALKRELKRRRVKVLLDTKVTGIVTRDGAVRGVEIAGNGAAGVYGVDIVGNGAAAEAHAVRDDSRPGAHSRAGFAGAGGDSADAQSRMISADCVVVATGGISYPSTGATGDGYRFARACGHSVTALYPSLVPIVCAEDAVRAMQGLSLKNVELHIKAGKKELFSEFGEMMFTHFGVTGPLVLSASAKIGPQIGRKELRAWIDLKPAITEETLEQRFLRLFDANKMKQLKNILPELYPMKMAPVIPEVAEVDAEKRAGDVTKQERRRLVEVTKHFPLTMTALRGYNEAVVTKGGVSVREIEPQTMASKRVQGLYFIGEVLDLDAYTGGYNLQIAWCTAAACAKAMTAKQS